MHHFHYRDGRLAAEDVDLTGLSAEVGTPFYCYSTATLERHYRVFADAFAGDELDTLAVPGSGAEAPVKTTRGAKRGYVVPNRPFLLDPLL